MPANDWVVCAYGIFNRNDLRSSPAGKAKSYFLSETERLQLIERYGPILKKRANRTSIRKEAEPQITKDQYLAFKQQGLKDKDILKKRIPGLHSTKLVELKVRWGLKK